MRYLILLVALIGTVSCERQPSGSAAGSGGEVVIYSSIDDPYLRPLMQKFEKESGIKVRIVTDTEATKSASLYERLVAEKSNPQADVYWGNEIFHAIDLAEQGILAPYRPKTADDIPAKWRDANDRYTDIGLRARMIALSTRPEHAGAVKPIHGLADLTNPNLKGKIAMSNPAFGTASGHVAALYLLWGEEKFSEYMKALKANEIKLLGGNGAVADQVAAGTLAAGLTDNDDINNAKADGQPIDGIFPDQASTGVAGGTLLIPGAVALIDHCQHQGNARKLIEFICDPAIEKQLIANRFLVASVRDPGNIKAMDVDYVKTAHEMKHAVEVALTILQERAAK